MVQSKKKKKKKFELKSLRGEDIHQPSSWRGGLWGPLLLPAFEARGKWCQSPSPSRRVSAGCAGAAIWVTQTHCQTGEFEMCWALPRYSRFFPSDGLSPLPGAEASAGALGSATAP